jgi:hypothetical protein
VESDHALLRVWPGLGLTRSRGGVLLTAELEVRIKGAYGISGYDGAGQRVAVIAARRSDVEVFYIGCSGRRAVL